jgi:WD40 repeat protein
VITPAILDEPYPGLRSFRRDETHIFFGREACINDMVQRLAAHRFLAVTGTSGSGKSSLVRTGLLDALDRGLLAVAGSDWRVADFRPGNNPLTALANALIDAVGAPDAEQEGARVEAILARGPLGLLEWLETTDLSSETNLLLLADQFEEIFRYQRGQAGDDINAFVALLLASAAQRKRPIYVVITMRSDFLGECSQFTGLAEAINDGQYLTPRLTREQCRSAIEGPAAVFGGHVESALTNRLLNDMGTNADQLPLAQHVLMRLWRIASARSGPDAGVLKLDDYERLGGIGSAPSGDDEAATGALNALSAHADEILSELSPDQQRLASILFRALTESQGVGGRDVRRPISLGEAAAIANVPTEQLVPIVDAFRAPGRNFLTPPINVPLTVDTVIDISHESLIRQWGTLRRWLREEYDAARTYRNVETNAKLWREGNSGLMSMPYLGIARAWREREQPNAFWAKRYGDGYSLAMEFLDKSLAAEQLRTETEEAARRRSVLRTRSVAVAMTVLAIIAVGFAYYGFKAASRAEKNAQEAGAAEAHAKQMSEQALAARDSAQRGQSIFLAELARERFAEGDLLHALLLSVEALPDDKYGANRPEVREARDMLARSYLQLATQKSALGHATTIKHLLFLPPGDRVVSASDDGTARIWDLNGRPLFVLDGHVGPVTDADVTVDGKLIATASVDGVARVWDAASGLLVTEIVGTGPLSGVRIRKDGKAIITSGPDGIARIWDIATGGKIAELNTRASRIKIAEFSPDSSQVLIVTNEVLANVAQVWDPQSGKLLKETDWKFESVAQAAYSLDGTRFALLGQFGIAEVWDTKTLTRIASFNRDCCNSTMAISRDGSLLALVGGMSDPVEVFDVRTRKRIWASTVEQVQDLYFTPDGSQLIGSSSGTGSTAMMIWDAQTGNVIASNKLNARAHPFAVSQDGKRIAAIADAGFSSATAQGSLIVWDVAQKPPENKSASDAKSSSLIIDNDGGRFLLIQDNGPTNVWDVPARRPVGTLLASGSTPPVAAFDPKGQWIAALSGGATIGIWSANNLQHVADIPNIAATGIAFSPDGRVLAASTTSAQFDIFDAGAPTRSEAAEGLGVPAFSTLSRDGHWLFIAGSQSVGQLWDLAAGHVVATITEPGLFAGAMFNPDGTRLITQAKDGTARLLDGHTGAELAVLLTDSAGFRFNASGDRMTTHSQTGEIRIWDTSTGKVLFQAENKANYIMMSADSSRLIAWSDHQLDVLDATLGQEIGTIKLEPASFPQITADGTRVIIEHGSTVAIWDAKNFRQIASLAGTWNDVQAISVRPNRDASRVVVKEDKGSLGLFDGTTGILITELDNQFDGATIFAPDGSRLALARQDGRIDLWDIVADKHLSTLNEGGGGFRLGVAISDDSSIVVTGTAGPAARVWNARTGKHIADLAGDAADFNTVFISPDSRRIVTLSGDGLAFVWDARSATKLAQFSAPRTRRDILSSADGNHIVSVGSTPQTVIFETGAWRVKNSIGGAAPTIATAFSPDSQRLITAVGAVATVWEVASGQKLAELRGHTADIDDARFSPDGTMILTVAKDKTIRLWNTANATAIASLGGDANALATGQFSPDGKHVVTISDNHLASLWRAEDGSLISQLGAEKHYTSMAFAPDGKTVLLFSSNEMASYDLTSGQAGGKDTMSIALVEGSQAGIDYVSSPFGNIVTSNDGSTLRSGEVFWRMPWSTQDYVSLVHDMLPRCLTQEERQKLYLDPAPPAWCLEMQKWPYNTPAWKQWLADKTAGKDSPMPHDQ